MTVETQINFVRKFVDFKDNTRGWHKNLISTCPGGKLDFISACPPGFELAPGGGKLDFIYSLPPRFWIAQKSLLY